MNDIDRLKQDLILASTILEWDIGDIWGHVSARLPDGKGFMLKHLRHRVADREAPKEIMTFDYEGNVLSGAKGVPKEIVLYTTLYRTRTDIQSVVHAHPPVVISMAAVNRRIVPMHLHSFVFRTAVPVYPVPVMICTDDEAKAVDVKMGKNGAVIIKGHGAVTVGRNLKDATIAMLYLERTARMIALAAPYGTVKAIPSKYIALQEKRLGIDKGPIGFKLEWEYFTKKLENGEWWSR
jgi:ribulose-5-phosphate 4-epimerase/fuculose-1-phosphate aldolase